MVPTEVLARQHYENMLELFEEKTPVGNLSIDITLRVLEEKQ